MQLAKLKLANFKNYESLSVGFSPRLNCLTGLNGMGKTNVLDAIYFLCLSRSHTGLSDKNLIRRGESFFRIEGHFVQDSGQTDKVVVKMPAGQRKTFEKNGAPVEKLTDIIGQYPVVMIAPGDVALIQEGSEERRRFLDSTLAQIDAEYLRNLLIYNNLIKQRNALLKSFAETRRFDEVLLDALDRQLPGPAAVLYARRAAFITEIAPVLTDCYAEISGQREEVSISYDSDLEKDEMGHLLANNRDKDRALERTSAGPHRDDLTLAMNGWEVKKFASQGQLKSFLLALRLAQYELLRREKGVAPLLLLDDIFDKLDEERVRQLVGLLIGRSYGQIFITDTQRGRMERIVASFGEDFRLFEVEAGAVR